MADRPTVTLAAHARRGLIIANGHYIMEAGYIAWTAVYILAISTFFSGLINTYILRMLSVIIFAWNETKKGGETSKLNFKKGNIGMANMYK